jgi:hypothetical protein
VPLLATPRLFWSIRAPSLCPETLIYGPNRTTSSWTSHDLAGRPIMPSSKRLWTLPD